MRYRGRFAPTPTGPLHFGSLVAAVGSYLQARAQNGEWLVRIDDVDVPRAVPGAADAILRVLDRLGLHWDGPVRYQTERIESYRAALDRLARAGWTYPCGCSRREIGSGVYPGTCREGLPAGRAARSLRMRTAGRVVRFGDAVQGACTQALATEVGDFVVDRADGIVAYHLATVVDDAEQRVTEVVRGADLLGSTPRQIHLGDGLGLPRARYVHLPVAVNAAGQKLSKQTHAPPLQVEQGAQDIARALSFLGQQPPAALSRGPIEELWRWAQDGWLLTKVPRVQQIVHRP